MKLTKKQRAYYYRKFAKQLYSRKTNYFFCSWKIIEKIMCKSFNDLLVDDEQNEIFKIFPEVKKLLLETAEHLKLNGANVTAIGFGNDVIKPNDRFHYKSILFLFEAEALSS